MKPRIRQSLNAFGPRYECGLMVPFFDAGWQYEGMSEVRGTGDTPLSAYMDWSFKAWNQERVSGCAPSAAQSGE